jgi:hypothetical protein
MNDIETTLGCHLAQVKELRLRMLVNSADPHIEGGARHARRPFFCGVVYPYLAT